MSSCKVARTTKVIHFPHSLFTCTYATRVTKETLTHKKYARISTLGIVQIHLLRHYSWRSLQLGCVVMKLLICWLSNWPIESPTGQAVPYMVPNQNPKLIWGWNNPHTCIPFFIFGQSINMIKISIEFKFADTGTSISIVWDRGTLWTRYG